MSGAASDGSKASIAAQGSRDSPGAGGFQGSREVGTSTTQAAQGVRHEPASDACAEAVRAHFARADDALLWGRAIAAWRAESRAALGLPADRPVVMTGHQAGIWHAGIAEKFVLGAEVARAVGGVLVHVVVDHDRNDASLVAYPAIAGDGGGGGARLVRLALDRRPRSDAPNALRGCVRTMRPDRPHEVAAGLEPVLAGIERAIAAERGHGNLAMQMAHAANALLAPRARVDHTVAATALAAIPFAAALRDGFDPLRDAYNAAVAGERIAPLAPRELPFWRLDRALGARAPLFAQAPRDAVAPQEAVAPRALALTAIARLVACDLFIHGTGGARYDRAMEAWIESAFGEATRAALAPMAMATATRHAPLAALVPPFDATATPEALRALEQDPFDDGGRTKAALVAAIGDRSTGRAERRRAYLAMRRAIAAARTAREPGLADLRARIAANAEARHAHALATDRAWPFPFAWHGSVADSCD